MVKFWRMDVEKFNTWNKYGWEIVAYFKKVFLELSMLFLNLKLGVKLVTSVLAQIKPPQSNGNWHGSKNYSLNEILSYF